MPPILRDPENNHELINEREFTAWYRKHYGERWVELYEARESERDHLKDPLKFYDMFKEMNRISNEKQLEHEREKKTAMGCAYEPNIFFPLSDTHSDTDSDKSEPMPEDPWERLEFARRHLGLYQSEVEYKKQRVELEIILEKQRKVEECKRVEEAEELAILRLARTNSSEYKRLWRRHKLRYMKGLTNEQIDDLDRKEAAARERGAWCPLGIRTSL